MEIVLIPLFRLRFEDEWNYTIKCMWNVLFYVDNPENNGETLPSRGVNWYYSYIHGIVASPLLARKRRKPRTPPVGKRWNIDGENVDTRGQQWAAERGPVSGRSCCHSWVADVNEDGLFSSVRASSPPSSSPAPSPSSVMVTWCVGSGRWVCPIACGFIHNYSRYLKRKLKYADGPGCLWTAGDRLHSQVSSASVRLASGPFTGFPPTPSVRDDR